MKRYKIISLAITAVMMLGLLTGCGASSDNATSYYSPSDSIVGSVSSDGFDSFFNSVNKSESIVVEDAYYDTESSVSNPETPSLTVPDENYLEKKIVYSAKITAQTKDMELARIDIEKMISDAGGYIESEYSYKNGGFDYGYTRTNLEMTIRIPSAKFQGFINGLENDNIYVNNLNKSSVDYSTSYYDKESRINSLRIQEERLYELLANASDVDVMLRIENQLSEIRYEIESLTKEMRFIDSQVDYSIINLSLEQVVNYDISTQEPTNFFEELIETIKDSTEGFGEWSKEALFAFIYMFPYLVIALIILFVVLKFRKNRKAKKIAKREKTINQMNEIVNEVKNNKE